MCKLDNVKLAIFLSYFFSKEGLFTSLFPIFLKYLHLKEKVLFILLLKIYFKNIKLHEDRAYQMNEASFRAIHTNTYLDSFPSKSEYIRELAFFTVDFYLIKRGFFSQ